MLSQVVLQLIDRVEHLIHFRQAVIDFRTLLFLILELCGLLCIVIQDPVKRQREQTDQQTKRTDKKEEHGVHIPFRIQLEEEILDQYSRKINQSQKNYRLVVREMVIFYRRKESNCYEEYEEVNQIGKQHEQQTREAIAQ